MLGRTNPLGRLFLESVHDPKVASDLDSIDDAKGIATERESNFKNPGTRPWRGFAMSVLPPSAAMVRAARHMDWASPGNFSKSFRADLIQDMARVVRVNG